jgi:Uma2 family endonuclease
MPAEKVKLYTVEEYLQLEEKAAERHEYRYGVIYPVGSPFDPLGISGGTVSHSLLCANMITSLGNRVRDTGCVVLDCNMRIGVPTKGVYTYPDVSVVCGPPTFDPKGPKRHTILNPRLLVEVLSDSTEAYDRGDKFELYDTIESLREYVLVSQKAARITIFSRQEDRTWVLASAIGLDSQASLHSLGVALPLSEVYRNVSFPPAPEVPASDTERS